MVQQRDAAWVKSASPVEIVAAKDAGELYDYMNDSFGAEIVTAKIQTTPAGVAANLGITVEELGHIEAPAVLSKIAAHNQQVYGPVQRDGEWVSKATAQQIDAAQRSGELHVYMGGQVNEIGNPVDAKGNVIQKRS